MNDTPVPSTLHVHIEILPSLNADGYTPLISAWVDVVNKSYRNGPLDASLEDVADWVANQVRAHILHRRADMEAGKALWLERTAALKHATS